MKHGLTKAAAAAALALATSGAASAGDGQTRITETPQVSQPPPFAGGGATVVVPRTRIEIREEGGRMVVILPPGGVTLKELVDDLNALGVGPRDMNAILQAIGRGGALHGEIVVR